MSTKKFKVSSFSPLTDNQWAKVCNFFEKKKSQGKKRKKDLRAIFNSILYFCRTGCQWRNIPTDDFTWELVRYYYDKFSKNKYFDTFLKSLVVENREALGRSACPSICAIDSQSIKIAPLISEDKGVDGYKKINGRKRHIVVDSQGFLLGVSVTAANVYDGNEGVKLLKEVKKNYKDIKVVAVDGTYKGLFEQEALAQNIGVEIAQKPESSEGFVPQKNRWQVERSFGWLNFYRRLSKDYEKKVINSENMIKIAFIAMFLNNIT